VPILSNWLTALYLVAAQSIMATFAIDVYGVFPSQFAKKGEPAVHALQKAM